jgi:tight adherence protein C
MFDDANTQDLLIALLIATVCFIMLMYLVGYMQRESLRKRLRNLAPSKEEAKEAVERERGDAATGFAATLEPILRVMGLRPDEFRRLNFYKFYRAGVSPVDGPVYYLAWKWFTTPVGLLVSYSLLTADVAPLAKIGMLIASVLIFILTYFGGDLYLKNNRAKREQTLSRSFPDTLDLLLVCTESGLALDAALQRVSRELQFAHPEITDELNKTRLELTLLNDRPRALQNLAERTDLMPFRSLVASLLQTERFGTSLNETLRVLADEYRNTRLMLAEQKAGSLPVKMTIPLITLMLPALFLIIMGPAVIRVFAVN